VLGVMNHQSPPRFLTGAWILPTIGKIGSTQGGSRRMTKTTQSTRRTTLFTLEDKQNREGPTRGRRLRVRLKRQNRRQESPLLPD
jgi:hypothetical protein